MAAFTDQAKDRASAANVRFPPDFVEKLFNQKNVAKIWNVVLLGGHLANFVCDGAIWRGNVPSNCSLSFECRVFQQNPPITEAIPNQQHPDQQFGINRWTASETVEIRQVRTDVAKHPRSGLCAYSHYFRHLIALTFSS